MEDRLAQDVFFVLMSKFLSFLSGLSTIYFFNLSSKRTIFSRVTQPSSLSNVLDSDHLDGRLHDVWQRALVALEEDQEGA